MATWDSLPLEIRQLICDELARQRSCVSMEGFLRRLPYRDLLSLRHACPLVFRDPWLQMVAVLQRMYPKHTLWTGRFERVKPTILRMPNAIISFITNLELNRYGGPRDTTGQLSADIARLQQALPRLHMLERLRFWSNDSNKGLEKVANMLSPKEAHEMVAFFNKIFDSAAYRYIVRNLPVIYQDPQCQTIRTYALEILSRHSWPINSKSLSGFAVRGVAKYRQEGTLPPRAVTWSQEKIEMVHFMAENVEYWVEEPPKRLQMKLRER